MALSGHLQNFAAAAFTFVCICVLCVFLYYMCNRICVFVQMCVFVLCSCVVKDENEKWQSAAEHWCICFGLRIALDIRATLFLLPNYFHFLTSEKVWKGSLSLSDIRKGLKGTSPPINEETAEKSHPPLHWRTITWKTTFADILFGFWIFLCVICYICNQKKKRNLKTCGDWSFARSSPGCWAFLGKWAQIRLSK